MKLCVAYEDNVIEFEVEYRNRKTLSIEILLCFSWCCKFTYLFITKRKKLTAQFPGCSGLRSDNKARSSDKQPHQ